MASGIFSNILLALVLAGIVTVPTLLPAEPAKASTSTGTGTNSHSSPANKVVATGEENIIAGPGTDIVLMTATAKTSKPTDMMLMVTLECAIYTQLITGGTTDEGATDTALASARLDVWIEIDDVIVPISSAASPPNDSPAPGDREVDSVTFCQRDYSRTVTDEEDPQDGLDEEDDYIRTKSAHAFNWIRQNMGSDTHKIEVVGELVIETDGRGTATIEIGNRVLIGEPTKMANDAII